MPLLKTLYPHLYSEIRLKDISLLDPTKLSLSRIRRTYQERDGFLLEMNSMNYEDTTQEQLGLRYKWIDEKENRSPVQEVPSPRYFTLENEQSQEGQPSLSRNCECKEKPVYREILNPGHLNNMFSRVGQLREQRSEYFPWKGHITGRSRIGSEAASYSAFQNSKPGSISSLDLEWENEESLDISACRRDVKYTTMEENGNTPFLRWLPAAEKQHDIKNSPLKSVENINTRTSSVSSLAWDNDNEGYSCSAPILDTETENLLSEIEELTSAALRETAQWARKDETPMSMSSSSIEKTEQGFLQPDQGPINSGSIDQMISSIDTDSSNQ
ncbi:uncharacterized protein LOC111711699 isoform X2 [Eurytemora carolleeae]|uniref:uncharacterized protein LOC111711699 isoform X2 n=1 Tax=Eurytemora carolleeae TaxID=1294199 RepID=UPI000C76012F|nr:uncharacterized protein LOC111711699 isoform X2 [Eurytemora carolleeae]|eukprot:XP_023341872.1 uncharacterized protein LOC111711699 isoform X2 [Eurytemora affinis]